MGDVQGVAVVVEAVGRAVGAASRLAEGCPADRAGRGRVFSYSTRVRRRSADRPEAASLASSAAVNDRSSQPRRVRDSSRRRPLPPFRRHLAGFDAIVDLRPARSPPRRRSSTRARTGRGRPSSRPRRGTRGTGPRGRRRPPREPRPRGPRSRTHASQADRPEATAILIEIPLSIGHSAGRETSRGYTIHHTRKLVLDARILRESPDRVEGREPCGPALASKAQGHSMPDPKASLPPRGRVMTGSGIRGSGAVPPVAR